MSKKEINLDFGRTLNKNKLSPVYEEALSKELEMSSDTKHALQKIEDIEVTSIDKIEIINEINDVKEKINNDALLSIDNKNKILEWLETKFWSIFSNTVDYEKKDYTDTDYYILKKESKFFSELSQRSFLQMAMRLKIINDNKLYISEYETFESFLQTEIPVHRSTVFTYIDIVTTFGFDLLLTTDNINFNYSKARPFLPILKSDDVEITQKEELKKDIFKWMGTLSAREMQVKAREEKSKFGIPDKKSRNVTTFDAIKSTLNSLEINIDKLDETNLLLFYTKNKDLFSYHFAVMENYYKILKRIGGQ